MAKEFGSRLSRQSSMPSISKACYSLTCLPGRRLSMNVSLTPELEKFVSGKVASGFYNSASEVVREALRLFEEHDRARGLQIAAFNKELSARLASLDRGETVDPE